MKLGWFKKSQKDSHKAVFRAYYEKAFKAAYYYCRDRHMAEEAAQEAIYIAVQRIDQLHDPDKIEAWIKTIAVNNSKRLIRHSQKVVSLQDTSLTPAHADTPEDIIDSQESVRAVAKAIDTLDPTAKQVLHLYYYEEMKVKNIALSLDIPEGTVKSVLYRGRKALREVLEMEGQVITAKRVSADD